MSKGKWVLGKINPKITLFMQILRASSIHTCCNCHNEIQPGNWYVKLSAAFKKFDSTVKYSRRCWYFHFGTDCVWRWAEANLVAQAREIEKKRGYNPLDSELPYCPSKRGKLGKP